MTKERAKQITKGSVPWAAVALAVIGWLEARSEATHAVEQVQVVQERTDTRDQHGWEVIRYVFEAQQEEIDQLHSRLDKLEEDWSMDEQPHTRRESKRKAARELPMDYDAVQRINPAEGL